MKMYSALSTNGLDVVDGSVSTSSAIINQSGMLPNPSSSITPDTSPRGIKRSCSPSTHDLLAADNLGDSNELRHEKRFYHIQAPEAVVNLKPRKRGRPAKARPPIVGPGSPNQPSTILSHSIPPTPQSQIASLSYQALNSTPARASPIRTTPTKTILIKALPTVRDHTTDQLGAEGDEYIPREYDEAGEKKVDANGQLNDGRVYKCRTFLVPNRGEKLFMLATECARVLGYRDSYLLFNKNRSLYKIIASQSEKEDLIRQDMLPYSYRSRQIAIVSAKSMFRQFGSRVIRDGRRVRDDYWESKARKQGFTEEDLAGEKRPGAAKARDAAAAAELNVATPPSGPQHDILYSNNPAQFTIHPQSHSLPAAMIGASGGVHNMVSLAPEQPDMRLRDYSNIQRPPHEITSPPYQDRTQPTLPTDLLSHAHHAAEYNKQINQQRSRNFDFLHRRWRQPHASPTLGTAPLPIVAKEELPSTQLLSSIHMSQQSGLQTPSSSQKTTQHMISTQSYSQASNPQNNIAPSPMRNINAGPAQPGQPGRPLGTAMGPSSISAGNSYGYSQQAQNWPPQAQPSSQSYPHFNAKSPRSQRSPHQIPQLRHSGSAPQMQPVMQFPGAQNLGQVYPTLGHNLYTSERGPQHFMQLNTSPPQTSSQTWAGQQLSALGSGWGWGGPSQ